MVYRVIVIQILVYREEKKPYVSRDHLRLSHQIVPAWNICLYTRPGTQVRKQVPQRPMSTNDTHRYDYKCEQDRQKKKKLPLQCGFEKIKLVENYYEGQGKSDLLCLHGKDG